MTTMIVIASKRKGLKMVMMMMMIGVRLVVVFTIAVSQLALAFLLC